MARKNLLERSNILTDRERAGARISLAAAKESIVLLENDGTLPLKEKKAAVFGAGARHTVIGGTGSGEVNVRRIFPVKEALEKRGFEVAGSPWLDRYEGIYAREERRYSRRFIKRFFAPISDIIINIMADPYRPPAGDDIREEDIPEGYGTCIYVLTRICGEGADRKTESYEDRITPQELQHLEFLSKHFEHLVLVLNVGAVFDLSFTEKIKKLSAVVHFGQQGPFGAFALADILSGELTPSGHLTDTWARSMEDYPCRTFGGRIDTKEVCREGIYNGYRYFDTFGVPVRYPFGYGLSYTEFSMKMTGIEADGPTVRLEAKVKNIGNKYSGAAVLQVYAAPPEGGLATEKKRLVAFARTKELRPGEACTVEASFDSYCLASFSEELGAFVLLEGIYKIMLGSSAEDVSTVAGLRTDGFKVLSFHRPVCGDTAYAGDVTPETVRCTLKALKTVREGSASGKGEEGRSEERTGAGGAGPRRGAFERDASEARGTDEEKAGAERMAGALSDEGQADEGQSGALGGINVLDYDPGEAVDLRDAYLGADEEGLSPRTGEDDFSWEELDPEVRKAEEKRRKRIEYSRRGIKGVIRSKMKSLRTKAVYEEEDDDDPESEAEVWKAAVESARDTLNELTLLEKLRLLAGAGRVHRICRPEVPGAAGYTTTSLMAKGVGTRAMADGPAGIRLERRVAIKKSGKLKSVDPYISFMKYLPKFVLFFLLVPEDRYPLGYQNDIGFPVGTMLAQTFDTAMVERIGRYVSMEMRTYGVGYWLAPGMNLHRNPMCGRNFEYFSEDPLLTGKLAAAMIRGVDSGRTTAAVPKHFACNIREDEREKSDTVVSERALRELYLRGFEIAVREARPKAIMSSYNKINGCYATETENLITGVLRGEWAFDGIVMTDWNATAPGVVDPVAAVNAGTDVMMPGLPTDYDKLSRGVVTGELSKDKVNRAAMRMLVSMNVNTAGKNVKRGKIKDKLVTKLKTLGGSTGVFKDAKHGSRSRD